MDLSLFGRRRIALLFLLGVGLPSLALAYLAFRGIRNELALLEQRRLAGHRALAEMVSDTVARRITSAEYSVVAAVAGHGDPFDSALVDSLRALKSRQPLIEEIFYLEDGGRAHLPAAELLYRPDGSLASATSSTWSGSAATHMQDGQRLEFQQRSYGAALISYRRAFTAVSDPSLKVDALVAITRVQRKSGRLDAAIESCRTLYDDYGEARTVAGVPVGPMARLERAGLLLAKGDTIAARDGYRDLYRRLVEGEWRLERAQYDFFAGQASALFDGLSGTGDGTLAALRDREAERRARAERLLWFQASAPEDVLARARNRSDGEGGVRFTLESAGRTYLVAALDRGSDQGGVWGLLIAAGYLRDELLRRVLGSHVDSVTTDWVVRGRDGNTLQASTRAPGPGSLSLNATFAGNFPSWLIEFYDRPQNPYRRLLASGQSIYVYMFLLIASILVFGTILTLRAVAHELELARLKSDFVSTVSHEFKSPLTSIRQLAEMLQAGRVPSEERRRRYYDVLVEQSSRLSSLVTNILDLARIEEGRKEFRFEPVDLGALVSDLTEQVQHRVGHEGFTVLAKIDASIPPVRADSDAIAQAVSNLVDNAIRYSGDARQIELRVLADDSRVTVAVEDHGVGIPESEIDRVFDRFYRGGDELTRSVKGSGLGLTLVKEIVEAHGGDVEVVSQPGRGSTFSIVLPTIVTEPDDAQDSDR